jgi:L-lactate dehydrogenase complex protein LldG
MNGIKRIEKMGSREMILENIAKHKSEKKELPVLEKDVSPSATIVVDYISVLEKIGGKAVEVSNWSSISKYITQHCSEYNRIVSMIPEVPYSNVDSTDPHALENVDLAVMKGHFGVAENAAIWITDDCMGDRALPFIAHNLALVISKNSIVPTLHQAYDKIDSQVYNLGTFIAGPSKTADIEQSLVLGAHGPKSLIVFLLADM